MNMRTIGIGIVAVALILAISMTASARPDPVGATTTTVYNNVTLATFNGTEEGVGTFNDGIALSTKQAQSTIYYKRDAGSGEYNISITYTNTTGGSPTVYSKADVVAGAWTTVDVSSLVDITNISRITGTATDYNITVVANLSKQTAAQGTASSDDAEGGYITEMDLEGISQTVKWQGYYGDITGDIRLADASGYYMYTWDWDSSTGGAVFAVARSTMPNFGVVGTHDITEAEADTALTSDDTWSATGADSVTLTFDTDDDNSAEFYVAGNTVAEIDRNAMYTLETLGSPSDFEEVLLTDRETVDTVDDMIWTCLIENQALDYTGGNSDYQMIVPATDIGGGTTTYYFYVEML